MHNIVHTVLLSSTVIITEIVATTSLTSYRFAKRKQAQIRVADIDIFFYVLSHITKLSIYASVELPKRRQECLYSWGKKGTARDQF